MKHVQSLARTGAVAILLIIVLAVVLKPLLPWLCALFMLACIIGIAMRDSSRY